MSSRTTEGDLPRREESREPDPVAPVAPIARSRAGRVLRSIALALLPALLLGGGLWLAGRVVPAQIAAVVGVFLSPLLALAAHHELERFDRGVERGALDARPGARPTVASGARLIARHAAQRRRGAVEAVAELVSLAAMLIFLFGVPIAAIPGANLLRRHYPAFDGPIIPLVFFPTVIVWTVGVALFLTGHGRRQLRRFARRTGGRVVAPLGGATYVSGERDGLSFEVRHWRGDKEDPAYVEWSVRLPGPPVAETTVTKATLAERLGYWRATGTDKGADLPGERLVPAAGASPAAAKRLLHRDEVSDLLLELLEQLGYDHVQIARDTLVLRVDRPSWLDLRPDELEQVLDRLTRLARLVARRELDVAARPAEPTFGWTGGGPDVLCPYCRDALGPPGPERETCPRCRTAHHAACLREAGGCTVFGCR